MSPLLLITYIFSKFFVGQHLIISCSWEVQFGFAKRFLIPTGIFILAGTRSAARTPLSRRDNGENPLEFRFPSANTHRRQNLIAELQVDVKLTHTEGDACCSDSLDCCGSCFWPALFWR